MVGIDQSLIVWLDHCSSYPMHDSTFHNRFFSSIIHCIISSSSFHYEIQKFLLEKKEKGNRKAGLLSRLDEE
ncbi:hypothetical protein Peur_063508 [Populus x canadensis]